MLLHDIGNGGHRPCQLMGEAKVGLAQARDLLLLIPEETERQAMRLWNLIYDLQRITHHEAKLGPPFRPQPMQRGSDVPLV